jgi:hypothetical protein
LRKGLEQVKENKGIKKKKASNDREIRFDVTNELRNN